jgi:uridine kinase
MSIIISIDGNIGSGKSTIIKKLKDQFGWSILEEPIASISY